MKISGKDRDAPALPVIMLAAIVTAALFSACASAPAGGSRPDWVLNPPEDADTIYGIGAMTSANESVGWKAAENRARASISYQLDALVEGMQTDYQTQIGAADITEVQEVFEDINRQLTSNAIGGAKIVKRGVAGKDTYYALASYSTAAIKTDVQNQLEAAALKGVKVNSQAALESLDANLAKKSKPVIVDKD